MESLLSKRTNDEIKEEIRETIIPQMVLYGFKDGMSELEIDKEITRLLGKNITEQLKTIKSGSFDRDWS